MSLILLYSCDWSQEIFKVHVSMFQGLIVFQQKKNDQKVVYNGLIFKDHGKVRTHCPLTLRHACQAGRQFVPFLWWSLVWPGRGMNPRPTACDDTLITKHPSVTSGLVSESCNTRVIIMVYLAWEVRSCGGLVVRACAVTSHLGSVFVTWRNRLKMKVYLALLSRTNLVDTFFIKLAFLHNT